MLFHNLGNGNFEDVTIPTGLRHVLPTMGCKFGDLDNDGWPDFYLGTGEPDLCASTPIVSSATTRVAGSWTSRPRLVWVTCSRATRWPSVTWTTTATKTSSRSWADSTAATPSTASSMRTRAIRGTG